MDFIKYNNYWMTEWDRQASNKRDIEPSALWGQVAETKIGQDACQSTLSVLCIEQEYILNKYYV